MLASAEGRAGAALAVAAGLAVVLGAVAGYAPEWTLFAALAAAATLVARRAPTLVVLALALTEPLQPMWSAHLPRAVRYLDEAIMLGFSASVLGGYLLDRRGPRRSRIWVLVRDPSFVLALGFVLTGVLSAVLNHVRPAVAAAGLFVTLDYVVLYFALRAVPLGPGSARLLCGAVLTLGLLATGAALLQQIDPATFTAGWQHVLWEGAVVRVPGLFEHPNDLGYFQLAATLLAVAHVFTMPRRTPMAGALAGVLGLGLALSVSRSSYVAVLLGIGVGLLGLRRASLARVIPALVAAVVVFSPFLVRGIESRLEKIRSEAGDARITYARQTLPILAAHPVLGVGPGRFGGEVAHRYGSTVYAEYGVEFNDTWTTVDSFWLHTAAEVGFLGVALLLSLLVLAAVRALTRLSSQADPWVRALALAAPMLAAAHLLINLSSMALEANTTAGLLWILLGTAARTSGDALGRDTAPARRGAP